MKCASRKINLRERLATTAYLNFDPLLSLKMSSARAGGSVNPSRFMTYPGESLPAGADGGGLSSTTPRTSPLPYRPEQTTRRRRSYSSAEMTDSFAAEFKRQRFLHDLHNTLREHASYHGGVSTTTKSKIDDQYEMARRMSRDRNYQR